MPQMRLRPGLRLGPRWGSLRRSPDSLVWAELRQFDTRRRFIISPVTAAVSDERRCSSHLFLVEVPAHHSAPSSAALAEDFRADCIQTISPRAQVSARVRTCTPYDELLSLLDYGNSTLAGVSSYLLSRLESVMNAAAQLIFSSSRFLFQHITPLLRQLH